MVAKRLCYVIAAAALCVVAFQFEVPRAGAQGAATLVFVIDSVTDFPTHYAVDSSGRLLSRDASGWRILAQCPPGRPINLALAPRHGDNYIIGMKNGDVYTFPLDNTPGLPIEFSYLGNVFSGTVGVQSHGWGAVKGEYRK